NRLQERARHLNAIPSFERPEPSRPTGSTTRDEQRVTPASKSTAPEFASSRFSLVVRREWLRDKMEGFAHGGNRNSRNGWHLTTVLGTACSLASMLIGFPVRECLCVCN